ncbi:MAG: ribonuclease P protein component [Candidatus Kerfeldbacteria bacterium]|nr:ribonuclease P protein component [Candidatus Kerfeldbacteria bacterium]
MLSRANRLRHTTAFSRVYQQGRAVGGQTLVVRARRTKPTATPRVGIVVGTKVSKRATARNRLRRQLRAAVRPRLPTARGFDLVIIAKSSALQQPFANLAAECARLIDRVTSNSRR